MARILSSINSFLKPKKAKAAAKVAKPKKKSYSSPQREAQRKAMRGAISNGRGVGY